MKFLPSFSIMRSVHLSRGFSHHWSWGTGAPLSFRYCHKCQGHEVRVVAPCSKFRVDSLECPGSSLHPLPKSHCWLTALITGTVSPLMLPCDHRLAGMACRCGWDLAVCKCLNKTQGYHPTQLEPIISLRKWCRLAIVTWNLKHFHWLSHLFVFIFHVQLL